MRIKKMIVCVLAMALAAFGVFAAMPALAQPAGGIPDINSLTAATTADDWSMKMWKSLLGDFAANPFSTLGQPTTLLGSVFLVFNAAVFVVGFTWAMYGVISGVVATAHEGEVLGRRMSSVWFPIRMVVGVAGMVPIFGGFTLNQAIMMFLTTVGIGIGNTIWTQAVDSTSQFQALMASQHMTPTSSNQVRAAAKGMFMGYVCMYLENAANQENRAYGAAEPDLSVDRSVQGTTHSYKFGNQFSPMRCGGVTIIQNGGRTNGNNELFSGYRVESVDYETIRQHVMNQYVIGMQSLESQMASEAANWIAAREAALDSGARMPDVPMAAIDAAATQLVDTVANSPAPVNMSGLHEAAKSNMLALGWFGAGAWFATLAEANAAIADASMGPAMTVTPVQGEFLSSQAAKGMVAAKASADALAEAAGAGGGGGDGTATLVGSAIRDTGCGALNSVGGTATGNCSLGQGIVSAAIRGLAVGSGGGGNGGGSLSLDSSGFVNPIIMMKNMGDYVMAFSSTLLLSGPIVAIVEKLPFAKGAALAKSAAEMAQSFANKTGGDGDGSFFAVLKSLAIVFLVLGAAMAVYIPLIPFITWMGAILAYAASVLEGLAGSTLHAMSHLDGDGDGLGQRTTHGYLFMINVLARPALMLIGFLVASALMIAIGTLQAIMFLPAMANVQGNSITGVASIMMFLIVFFVMNLTLIQASFNLIYVITDQVIGFVGNAINSTLGRDTEDKVNNLFLMSARVGPGAIGAAGAAKNAAKNATEKAKSAAGRGGNGGATKSGANE